MGHFSPLVLDFIALYLYVLKLSFPVTALLVFISAIDDLFIDIVYFTSHLGPRQTASEPVTSADQIRPTTEKPIAVMVPAWDEKTVIASMLENFIGTTRYHNYHIFVGTYPNDPATREQVEALKRRSPEADERITVVSTDQNGPTSKGQCLNKIYDYITRDEKAGDGRNRLYVLHDAEDVVHPKEMWLFNHFSQYYEMVQLPVHPYYRKGLDLIGGHYADEFAEAHRRDLPARMRLTKGVPSAGISCAFTDEALRRIAKLRGKGPFNEQSVTEDYDLALTILNQGLSLGFISIPSSRVGDPTDCVCAQALFPNSIRAAVRQKARWIFGNSLQGWQNLGWQGSLAQRYMLFRDRKVLLTAPLNIYVYFLLLNIGIFGLLPHSLHSFPAFGAITEFDGYLGVILLTNVAFLINRIAQRVYHVGQLYNYKRAAGAIPRLLMCNFINCCAVLRALWLFWRHLKQGGRPNWDKTEHSFPDLADNEHIVTIR